MLFLFCYVFYLIKILDEETVVSNKRVLRELRANNAASEVVPQIKPEEPEQQVHGDDTDTEGMQNQSAMPFFVLYWIISFKYFKVANSGEEFSSESDDDHPKGRISYQISILRNARVDFISIILAGKGRKKCKICKKLFSGVYALKNHINVVHRGSNFYGGIIRSLHFINCLFKLLLKVFVHLNATSVTTFLDLNSY